MLNQKYFAIPRGCSLALLLALALTPAPASAEGTHETTVPQSHAPINVMGDHLHQHGEVMFSYRYMHMDMAGNRDGTSRISPAEIAISAGNPFANPPMQPPTLRVVPTEMTMDMHMLGMMYAPNNNVTLMLMTSYQQKKMKHLTFMGPMGANLLGEFETETKGFGDTSISALIRLTSNVHFTTGVSLPTGAFDETDQILTPMNTTPSSRLPYPMQLGSGSTDLIVGLTYVDGFGHWAWGAQWRSVLRIRDNSEDYRLGDLHKASAWGSYQLNNHLSLSARLEYRDGGNIEGMDDAIRAPVQTADPDRQGMQRVDAALGLNVLIPNSKHRLGIELLAPIHQDLDGPQLETDWTVAMGWQYSP